MTEEHDPSDTDELMLSSDPALLDHQTRVAKRRAQILSNNGWKFQPQEGPRGHYFEAYGPGGRRMMSKQDKDLRAAFVAAINHAFRIQFW